MRIFFSIFTILGFAVGLQSATQTIKVSPLALTGWTVTGADQTALAAQPTFALPAGVQLSRQFQSSSLTASVTSQILIGVDSKDWPVIEIGTAALVFSRNGTNGKLLLIAGDDAPVELPVAFALDKEGRSVEPLTINFGRDSSAVTIEAFGKTMTFPVGTDGASSLELVISAGSSEPWLFDDLEVTADLSPAAVNPDNAASSNKPTDSAAGSQVAAVNGPQPSSLSILGNLVVTAIIPVRITPSVKADTSATLEIFTLPAVRRGRVEMVRAAAAQGQKK